jgi:hypothetical protein
VNTRLRRLTRGKTCPWCGTALQPVLQQKYDPFWVVVLIFVGAALTFFLVGIALMFLGLRMLSSKKRVWACPACSDARRVPNGPLLPAPR